MVLVVSAVTVNTALPASSATETSSIVRSGKSGGGLTRSSSMIVPTPVPSAIVAAKALLRFTVNCSLLSASLSSSTVTEIGAYVSPARMVTVPLLLV